MAIAKIFVQNGSDFVAMEIDMGRQYSARMGGYGIIVIEDTMTPVSNKPVDSFKDGNLAIIFDPVTQYGVAACQAKSSKRTTSFVSELIITAIKSSESDIKIIVGTPL
jgi:hypothetical protein